MNSSHIIKLRGGWKIVVDQQSQPLSLPCSTAHLSSLAMPQATLIRRFQHPPLQSANQLCRLFALEIQGSSQIHLDGLPITAESLLEGHPLSANPHQLTLAIHADQLPDSTEWGQFWIEIQD